MAILPQLLLCCVLFSEVLCSLTVSTIQVEQVYHDLSAHDDHNEVNVDNDYDGQKRKREVQDRDDKIYWNDNVETQKYGQGAVVTKVLYHGIYPSLNVTEEIGKPQYWAQSESPHRVKRSGNFSKSDSWSSSSINSQVYAPPGSGFSLVQNGQSFSAGHTTYTQTVSSSGSTWINGQLVTTTTKRPLTIAKAKNRSTPKSKKNPTTTTHKPKSRFKRWIDGSLRRPSNANQDVRHKPQGLAVLEPSHRAKRSGNFSKSDSWSSSSINSQVYAPPGSGFSLVQNGQSFSAGHTTYTQTVTSSGSTWINGQLVTTTTKRPLTTAKVKNRKSTPKSKKNSTTTTRKPKSRSKRWIDGSLRFPSNAEQDVDIPRVNRTYEKADQTFYEQFFKWRHEGNYSREDPTHFKVDLHNRRTMVDTGAYYRFNDSTDALRSYHNPRQPENSFIGSVQTIGILEIRQKRDVGTPSVAGWRGMPGHPNLNRGNVELRPSTNDPTIRYRRFSGVGSTRAPSDTQQNFPRVLQALPSSSDSNQSPYIRADHSNSPGFYTRQQGQTFNSSKQTGPKYRTLYIPETNPSEYKGDPHNKGHVKLVSVAYYSTNRSNDALRSYHNARNEVSSGVRRKRDTWCGWLDQVFQKIGLYKPDPPSNIPQSEPFVMNLDGNEIDQNIYGFSSNGNGHQESGIDSLSKEPDFVSGETEEEISELPPTLGPVIIQAPQRKIPCKPPKRLARGRCRTVW